MNPIEHNDRYCEWLFDSVFRNINIEKRTFPGQKDSISCISSGRYRLNVLVDISRRLFLPEKSKIMELGFIYAYQVYSPDAKMTLRTRFFTHNTLIRDFVEKALPMPGTDKNGNTHWKRNEIFAHT
jgi:hypothetical protein